MISHRKIAMVILAAGASTRMKKIKQLLPWKNTTLLGHSIEQGLSSNVDSIFVVLGANREKIIPTLKDNNIEIIINDDWEYGLGKSIACAMRFISNSPSQFDGILIALGDQPLLNATHYNKMITEFSENNGGIVATKQPKTIGVPAIFSQKYFNQLDILSKDEGAKSVINRNLEDANFVNVNNNTSIDIDTSEDYKKLYVKYGS